MKDALKIALGVAITIGLMLGLWFGITQFQRATADYRGETDLIEDTEANAHFRRTAYETFFDLCASVQSAETRIDALVEELHSDPPPRTYRAEELRATITAVRSQRASQINQYNADAAKDWTVGQFQANGLPHRLNEDQEKTTCAA